MSFIDPYNPICDILQFDIKSIPNLSKYSNILTLNLTNNKISSININYLPPNIKKLILTKNIIDIAIDTTVISAKIKHLVLNDNKISSFYGQNFKNITKLRIDSNQLTEFVFPPNIKHLDISGNKIKKLQNFPLSLLTINCGNNMLTELPTINENLIDLTCNLNGLNELPKLPDTLRLLDASDNLLNNITQLPNNLRDLFLNGNLLSEINALPEHLNDLNLDENQFVELPYLPTELKTLCIKKNLLKEINPSEIPLSITHLDISHNKLIKIPYVLHERIERFNYEGNCNITTTNKYSITPDDWDNDNDDTNHLYNSDNPFGNNDFFSPYETKPNYNQYSNYNNFNNPHLNQQRNFNKYQNHHNYSNFNNYSNYNAEYFNDTGKYNFVDINLKNPRCVSIYNTKTVEI